MKRREVKSKGEKERYKHVNAEFLRITRRDKKAFLSECKEIEENNRMGKTDAGNDWRQEEEGTTEDEMAGWHHWLDGREFERTPAVGDGHKGLACCNSWGRKELDTTEWMNRTELKPTIYSETLIQNFRTQHIWINLFFKDKYRSPIRKGEALLYLEWSMNYICWLYNLHIDKKCAHLSLDILIFHLSIYMLPIYLYLILNFIVTSQIIFPFKFSLLFMIPSETWVHQNDNHHKTYLLTIWSLMVI